MTLKTGPSNEARIPYVTFDHKADVVPKPEEATKLELIEKLSELTVSVSKDKARLFSPVTYRAGTSRGNKNIEQVSALVLDYDDLTEEQFGSVIDALEAFGLDYFIYSSHSNNEDSNCFRLVLFLTRPLNPNEHRVVGPFVNQALGGLADPVCKDAARFFYFHSASPEGQEFSFTFSPLDVEDRRTIALPLDVDDVLAQAGGAATWVPSTEVEIDPSELESPRPGMTEAEIRGRLNTLRRPESAELMKEVLRGRFPWPRGDRDLRLLKIAGAMAFGCKAATADQLLAVATPSLEALCKSDGELVLDDEKAKFLRKLQKQQRNERAATIQAEAQLERDNAAILRTLGGRAASAKKGNGTSFAGDDSAEDSNPVGEFDEPPASKDAWAKREDERDYPPGSFGPNGRLHYVTTAAGMFCMDPDFGEYTFRTSNNFQTHYLKWARAAGLSTTAWNSKNQPMDKGWREVVSEHGYDAKKVQTVLGLKKSHYDVRTGTFFESAGLPRPELVAMYNPEVNNWLELLGGQKLIEWLSFLTDLEKQNSILFVCGPPGSGKSMLWQGAARVFTTGGPSTLGSLWENFSDNLMQCPLVYADEHLPSVNGKKLRTEHLREASGTNTRPLRRKYQPESTLVGAIRIIVVSNTPKTVVLEDDQSADAAEAVRERFLFLRANRNAVSYLQEIGGREGTDGWVSEDKIAKHILHLIQSRTVKAGNRFCVQGNGDELQRMMATQGGVKEQIVEWMSKFLQNPEPLLKSNQWKYVFLGNGKLLLNVYAISDGWDLYMDGVPKPSTGIIRNALANLSENELPRLTRRQKGASEKTRVRYQKVKLDLITQWMDQLGVFDIDKVEKLIHREVEENVDEERPEPQTTLQVVREDGGTPVHQTGKGV